MKHDKEITSTYRVFEDRRNYPRLKLNRAARISAAGGQVLDVVLYDLSPESAQIRFPISAEANGFLNRAMSKEEIKSLRFSVQFELSYRSISTQVKVNAHPVYLRAVDDKALASGILFVENKWEEMKKISDYLFYQLETAFSDSELMKKFKPDDLPENSEKNNDEENGSAGGQESNSGGNHNSGGNAKAQSDIEFLKTEMLRISSSLQTIQETTRQIDEKVQHLEKKLPGKG